jgi:hypothetical protein
MMMTMTYRTTVRTKSNTRIKNPEFRKSIRSRKKKSQCARRQLQLVLCIIITRFGRSSSSRSTGTSVQLGNDRLDGVFQFLLLGLDLRYLSSLCVALQPVTWN